MSRPSFYVSKSLSISLLAGALNDHPHKYFVLSLEALFHLVASKCVLNGGTEAISA
jgi:hypothetical protein